LANKHYISIIRLFEHCGISTERDFNLPRAKKQLQAEFGIAQGGFIEIDGYSYTKHDVFEELERPDFTKRLEFHKQIWNTPPLLNLLEDNAVDFLTIRDGFRAFWNNPEFDKFFSPYFAGPFQYVSRNLLSEKRLAEMGEWLSFEDFLQADEREEAFRPLRLFFEENLRVLRNTTLDNYKMMRPQLLHWIETDWFDFFNNLPHEFYDVKEDMTVRLINLGVAIQKKHRKDCRTMSEQLVSLQEVPESIRKTIDDNHTAYTQSKPSGSNNFLWLPWILVMIIKGAWGGCNDDTDTDYKYLNNSEFTRYQIDSLLKPYRDSAKPSLDTVVLDYSKKVPKH
jgi:hypothetical protein